MTPLTSNNHSFENLAEKFKSLNTRVDVANLLEISDRGLCHLLYVLPKEILYKTFEIKKKSGGMRKITAPTPRLKEVQERLLKVLYAVYNPKDSTHGFVIGRSISTNAKVHIRNKYVLNIDLEEFFPSINFGRVRGMFMANPYSCNNEVATVLAQICCYNNYLPQGSPLSPLVSNMICARLDSHLNKLAKKYFCQYSRYADDITISTNKPHFPVEIAKITELNEKKVCKLGNAILSTINNNGFNINQTKTRLQKSNERQVVTGLVTNKKINVPRSFIRNVRAMLFNWKNYGLAHCQREFEAKHTSLTASKLKQKLFSEMVRGKIDFIGTVRGKEDTIYLRLLQQLADLNKDLLSRRTLNNLRLVNNRYDHILDNLWVVESTSENDLTFKQGTGFYLEGFGVITCAHILHKSDSCIVEIYHRDNTEKQFTGIIKKDEKLDIAILSLRHPPEYSFEVSHNNIEIGEKIWLAGFPNFGPKNTGIMQSGEVIGKKTDVDGNPKYVISAHILEGNSGGPIFNTEWKVIGIAVKGLPSQYDLHKGIFFEVIPINQITNLYKNNS